MLLVMSVKKDKKWLKRNLQSKAAADFFIPR